MTKEILQPGDALLIVDVQVDFCPGGALPVPQGDRVVPVINGWIKKAREAQVPVYASRDWHPKRHISFKEEGGPWPPHCLQDSPGAAFHPELQLPEDTILITKGTRFDQDQYSAFDQTGLAYHFKKMGTKRVWVCGLALDVCVKATALQALQEGFEVFVMKEASQALSPEGGKQALLEVEQKGGKIV